MWLELTLFSLFAALIVVFSGELVELLRKFNIPILQKKLIQHGILAVALSCLIVWYAEPLVRVLYIIQESYQHTLQLVARITGDSAIAIFAAKVAALSILSCLPSTLIVGVYWLARKQFFSYFYQVSWLCWIILVIVAIID